ncbi:MAG: hypothetical protein KKB13_08860 [Chloroflexi bacterium]|nr:hypothetical protein [Chloroflexota bacterium]
MRIRLLLIGVLLLAGCGLTTLACQLGPASPTPAPTATAWVQIITATPSPTTPAEPTIAPTQPPPVTVTPIPPGPTPTLPPPEPDKPVAQIIAPAEGAIYSVGQAVPVQFAAGDQSGVTRVELYVGQTRVAYHEYPQRPTTISNDTLQWTPSAAGNYTLQVVAVDPFNNGSTPAVRHIVVQRNTTAPTVRIDYPTQRVVIVARQGIQIKATINDEGGIQGLELVERRGNQETVYTGDPNYHNVPYPWSVWWQSAEMGDHTLFVRAHDANGGVGQSPDFVIGVTDDDPPQVQVSYSTTSLSPGSNLRVHVEALDSKGVKELRLLIDNNVVDAWTAPDPAVGQSHVSADLYWRNVGPAGAHAAHVWAQDTTGNQAQSPDQTIQVVQSPPTPTPPPPTPTPPPPPPTPTPRPAAPQAAIVAPPNGFQSMLGQPVHFVANAVGQGRLDRVELWGYPQGQPSPQLIQTWPAGGVTNFTGQFDWVPPNAGVFLFYARAYDQLGQHGDSPQISGHIEPPTPPTPTPQPGPTLVGHWGAQAGDGDSFLFIITDQHASGRLKGTLIIQSAGGQPVTDQFTQDSMVAGNQVTIHAQIGSVMYNFMLTLAGDDQTMDGNWSTSQTGLLQPITFQRLLTQ